jgi:hypothetical protein
MRKTSLLPHPSSPILLPYPASARSEDPAPDSGTGSSAANGTHLAVFQCAYRDTKGRAAKAPASVFFRAGQKRPCGTFNGPLSAHALRPPRYSEGSRHPSRRFVCAARAVREASRLMSYGGKSSASFFSRESAAHRESPSDHVPPFETHLQERSMTVIPPVAEVRRHDDDCRRARGRASAPPGRAARAS